jgi:hypothetical protein
MRSRARPNQLLIYYHRYLLRNDNYIAIIFSTPLPGSCRGTLRQMVLPLHVHVSSSFIFSFIYPSPSGLIHGYKVCNVFQYTLLLLTILFIHMCAQMPLCL